MEFGESISLRGGFGEFLRCVCRSQFQVGLPAPLAPASSMSNSAIYHQVKEEAGFVGQAGQKPALNIRCLVSGREPVPR